MYPINMFSCSVNLFDPVPSSLAKKFFNRSTSESSLSKICEEPKALAFVTEVERGCRISWKRDKAPFGVAEKRVSIVVQKKIGEWMARTDRVLCA